MIKRTVVVFAAFALVTFGAAVAPSAAQSVDEIVARHYATKGGAEKWKSIQTQVISGTAWGQGTEVGMTIYTKRPNLFRQEIVIDIPGQGPLFVVTVFDGVAAWASDPMSGSEALLQAPAAEAAAARDQADVDGGLLDYQAKGHTVELVGTETLNDAQVHHLKVTRKDQPVQHYYLDVDTALEVKIVTEAGAGPESVTLLSDYKAVDGVQVAHLVSFSQGGVPVGELRVESVEFNVALDEGLFKGR